MRYIITVILLLTFAYSSNGNDYRLLLTKKEIEYIKKSSNKNFIIKRFKQYKQLTKKIKSYSTIKKLAHVNSFFNRIMPQLDSYKYGIDDYWSTQKEFLIQGKGDCEDYVISKYFTLLEVGIPKDKLYLSIVKVKGQQTNHMVLLYVEDKQKSPLVLDNLSFKVLPLSERKNLLEKVAFNEYDSYAIKKSRLSHKVNLNWQGDNKWEKLLNRVYTLKE